MPLSSGIICKLSKLYLFDFQDHTVAYKSGNVILGLQTLVDKGETLPGEEFIFHFQDWRNDL